MNGTRGGVCVCVRAEIHGSRGPPFIRAIYERGGGEDVSVDSKAVFRETR